MGNESLRSAFGIGRLGDLDACRLRARATAANRRCPISNRRHACASRARAQHRLPASDCAQTLFGPTLRWRSWQLAPTSRDLPPAEYDRPFDGEVKIFGMNSTKRPYGGRVAVLTTSAREIRR